MWQEWRVTCPGNATLCFTDSPVSLIHIYKLVDYGYKDIHNSWRHILWLIWQIRTQSFTASRPVNAILITSRAENVRLTMIEISSSKLEKKNRRVPDIGSQNLLVEYIGREKGTRQRQCCHLVCHGSFVQYLGSIWWQDVLTFALLLSFCDYNFSFIGLLWVSKKLSPGSSGTQRKMSSSLNFTSAQYT